MALTHVVRRDKEHGLKRITPEEAARLYPDGRPLAYNEFMCEVCFQYTIFVAGGKNRPHFKHGRGSDDCDEKLSIERQLYTETNPLGFSLPLIIRIENDVLTIWVGFPPVPNDEIDSGLSANASVKVLPKTLGKSSMQPYRYDINHERFSTDHVVYLNIGSSIAKQYELVFSSVQNTFSVDKHLWPRIIEGFSENGTLFSCTDGKRLPNKSSVVVSRSYYLFTKRRVANTYADVSITPRKSLGLWNVYEVSAIALSSSSVDFFRDLGALLTDSPSVITQLWPIAIQSSHVISFNRDQVYFHSTDGFASVHPPQTHVEKLTEHIFSVSASSRQVMTISRYKDGVSVLRYIMLIGLANWREAAATALPLCDVMESELQEGAHHQLPKRRSIKIQPKYDGFVESRRENCVVDRKRMKAGQTTIIDVSFDHSYHFYQGLEEMKSISFVKKNAEKSESDQTCIMRLQGFSGNPISIPSRTLLGIAAQMSDMPLTQLWIRNQLLKGSIDSQALKWLKKHIGGN